MHSFNAFAKHLLCPTQYKSEQDSLLGEADTWGVWDEPGAREPREPGGRRDTTEGFLEKGKS